MKKILAVLLATLVGAALLAVAPTAGAAPAKKFTVNASFSKGTVILGQSLMIRGSVTPRPKKAKSRVVFIQQKRGNGWVTVRRTGVTAAGRFGASVTPSAAGNAWYRVVKARTKKRAAGVSRVGTVNVYRWHYLTDSEYVDQDTFEPSELVHVNGAAFKKSLVTYFSSSGYVEYNLRRACTQLRTTVGLSDESSSDAKAIIEVMTDGTERFKRQFSLGSSAPIVVNTATALRVRFEATEVDGDPYSAIGSPRVLCKF